MTRTEKMSWWSLLVTISIDLAITALCLYSIHVFGVDLGDKVYGLLILISVICPMVFIPYMLKFFDRMFKIVR